MQTAQALNERRREQEENITLPSHDAEYWRKRAEEARALSEEMNDPNTRSLLLGIAKSYEEIAKSSEKIADFQKPAPERK